MRRGAREKRKEKEGKEERGRRRKRKMGERRKKEDALVLTIDVEKGRHFAFPSPHHLTYLGGLCLFH